MEAKIDIFLCKVFYSLIFNKLWRPVTLLYLLMGYLIREIILDLIPLFGVRFRICFKLLMPDAFRTSSEGGWTPSANICGVFIKGVMNTAVGVIVVCLIS